MQETQSDDYPGLATANIALVVLFCTYVLSFVDRQILALMVGPIREAFGITDFQFSILHGAAFAIMYAMAGLPLGRRRTGLDGRLIVRLVRGCRVLCGDECDGQRGYCQRRGYTEESVSHGRCPF